MKKRTTVTINVHYKDGKVVIDIPRYLFHQYLSVWGNTENAMKIESFRQIGWMGDDKEKYKRFMRINQNRFDAHEQIFNSVGMKHVGANHDPNDIITMIQFALDHWLKSMEDDEGEPSEYNIIEVNRARCNPRVQVIKYKSKGRKNEKQ